MRVAAIGKEAFKWAPTIKQLIAGLMVGVAAKEITDMTVTQPRMQKLTGETALLQQTKQNESMKKIYEMVMAENQRQESQAYKLKAMDKESMKEMMALNYMYNPQREHDQMQIMASALGALKPEPQPQMPFVAPTSYGELLRAI